MRVTKEPKKTQNETIAVANWLFVQTTHIVGSKSKSGSLREIVLSFKFNQSRSIGLGEAGWVDFCAQTFHKV